MRSPSINYRSLSFSFFFLPRKPQLPPPRSPNLLPSDDLFRKYKFVRVNSVTEPVFTGKGIREAAVTNSPRANFTEPQKQGATFAAKKKKKNSRRPWKGNARRVRDSISKEKKDERKVESCADLVAYITGSTRNAVERMGGSSASNGQLADGLSKTFGMMIMMYVAVLD